ncbi:MAG: hypothetical protein U0324_45105 [Polyangiales bacterium]
MRRWTLIALLTLATPAPALAQRAGRCLAPEWRPSARDLLATGVTYALQHPAAEPSPAAPVRARPLLAAMQAHLRALRAAPLTPAPALALTRREIALHARHLAAVDALTADVSAQRDAPTIVEALVLQGEAHEHAAARLVRFSELTPPDPAASQGLRRLAAIVLLQQVIARLEGEARRAREGSLVGGRRRAPDLAAAVRIDQAIEALRAQIDQERNERRCPQLPSPEETCVERMNAAWDGETSAHRMVAVVLYATAVHLAREHHVVTERAWWAAGRLLDEDLRGLREQALGYQRFFAPRPGEFDLPPPGAVALETALVSGARLATR